jgi:hypothetical protein
MPVARRPSFRLCVIEPDYNGITENDDHPPHDIMKAQKLLADVYNAIRSNESLWESTLLVVLYDEHGGFYDHVETPPAVPPDDHHEEYTFDRFGVRVPAVLVSPWVKQGLNSTLFDHTSVLKYLIDKWNLGSLGRRTAQANSIGPLVQADALRTDTVDWIELSADELRPPSPDLEEDAAAYLSGHHRALARVGDHLIAELDEEAPRFYSWLARLYESLKGFFVGKAKTPQDILKDYETAKGHCLTFLARRKEQAIPKLAAMIRDTKLPEHIRHHAAEALGYAVNRQLHREKNPAAAALNWLNRHGK